MLLGLEYAHDSADLVGQVVEEAIHLPGQRDPAAIEPSLGVFAVELADLANSGQQLLDRVV